MQVGRFFSLQQGRVGQYLSPRVLVVRTPFRPSPAGDICYFGFDRWNQAQKFSRYLANLGYNFQLRRSHLMPQSFEIRLQGHSDLARTLAYWDRVDLQHARSIPAKQPASLPIPAATPAQAA